MLHVWMSDQLVIGAGAGLGVLACGADCPSVTGPGIELRVAYAMARDGRGMYVGVEAGNQWFSLTDYYGASVTLSITTLLAQVGYATF
jgi:hypothetical protein